MVYFLLLCFAIIGGLVFRKSKFFLICIYILLYIISMYSGYGNDLSNLNSSYDLNMITNDANERSIVFYSLMNFFNMAGFSFHQFRQIHFIIFNLSILFLILRFTRDYSYVVACCAIFPILSFSSQMRNGLGVAFLYLGLVVLMTIKKKTLKVVIYLLLLSLAITIHYIFAVYLLAFVPLFKWNRKVLLKRSLLAMCFLLVIILGGRISFVSSLMGDWYGMYFSGLDFSISVQVPLIIFILINTFFTCKCEDYVMMRNYYSADEKRIVSFTSRLNIVFIALIPLLLLSGSFFRIYQNIFILSIVSIAITSSHYYVKGISQGSYLRVLYFLFHFFLSVFYLYWQGEFFVTINSIAL